MGFSLTAASCCLGIAFLIVFETITGAIIPLVSDVHTSYNDMMNQKFEKTNTLLEISNVSTNTNGTETHDLTIFIENNGGTTISMNNCNILLNGMIRSFHVSDTVLFPQEKSQFQIYNITDAGEIRLKVVTGNDIETYYKYNI